MSLTFNLEPSSNRFTVRSEFWKRMDIGCLSLLDLSFSPSLLLCSLTINSVLSNAQVAVILQVSAGAAVHRDEELNEVYRKTQRYVNRFNSMTNAEKQHQELVDELDNLQECVLIVLEYRFYFGKSNKQLTLLFNCSFSGHSKRTAKKPTTGKSSNCTARK